jgi:hypothetical protein
MNKFFEYGGIRKHADGQVINYGADPRIAQLNQAKADMQAPDAETRAAGHKSMSNITKDFKASQGGPGMFTFDKLTAPLAYMGGLARPVSKQIMKGGQFVGDMSSKAYGDYSDAAKAATDILIDDGANMVRDAKIGMNNLVGKARRGMYGVADDAMSGLAYVGGVTRPIAQGLESAGKAIGDAAYDAHQRGRNAVRNTALNVNRGALNALDKGLGAAITVGQGVRDAANATGNAAKSAWNSYDQGMRDATDRVIDGGSRMVRDAKIGMNNLAGKARRGAYNALDQGLGAAITVGQGVRDAGNTVANKAKAGYNKVRGWGSRIGGWLKRQHDRGMRAVRDTNYYGD